MVYGRPERQYEMVECGPNLEPLRPTPYLQFIGGQLEQWCEASCTVDGVTHTKGKWCKIPSSEWR